MKELTTTTGLLLNRLYQKIEHTTHQDPHPGLIIATHHFFDPFPLVNDISLLSLATMDLLIQFVYPSLSGYGKFTICFTMKRSNGDEISFTLGSGIPLTYDDKKLIPKSVVYAHILRDIKKYAEIYDGESIVRLMIRVYMESKKMDRPALSSEERDSTLSSIIEAGLSDEIEPISARDSKRSSQPTHITALKQCCTKLKPFMVADTETLLKDDVHKTYAAGLLMVRPGEQINVNMVETYFCGDYSIIYKSFEERCTKVLSDLVERISTIVRQEQTTITIYFHNFSRFDGILLLKHLACHHKSYKLKPLMRNHRLYEIGVYSDNRLLFRFRDSLNLLPGKLQDLAKNLCPGLGPKGSIPYDEITESNVEFKKKELCEYMKQDILLLGGVMKKAQEIYFKLYNVDIERKITISSLALTIFRMKYYDESNWPIHIPNKNEDTFIRRAYYGAHTDVYIPYGENLNYYDVNSLYPFVMKESPMPGGEPVWHRNLEDKDIDSLFGFIMAYVVCPKTIKRPFLPYRDKNNTLIFPTGEFVGHYYSEELKFAKSLGYTVIPIEGYLFEKMESPLKNFVSSLFESRLEARKEGNESLSYVYKILMNSLYGRFGINPKSTITEICDEDQYNHKIRHSELIFADMLSENKYIVCYHSNTDKGPDYWNPPKNSAVQLAAAITASARIYMYPYISREDCYYTDTDSVVLGSPLPEGDISSTVLGKFKLEDRVRKGYFLAPKSYFYIANDGSEVLKYKGPAKSMVNAEWFESQFADIYRKKDVKVVSNFRIDWKSLHIKKIETLVSLGITIGTKRKAVFVGDVWKDTDPIEIEDLSSLDHVGIKIIKSLRNKIIHLETENQMILEKFSKREREIAEINKEMNDQTSLTEDRTLLDKEEPDPETMYPELMKNKDLDDEPPSLANGEENLDDPP